MTPEFAAAGLTGLGSALGLDYRIISLVSAPIRASIGGFTQGLLNPNVGVLDSIKDSLFSSETLKGVISLGTSIGLDAIGVPPVLQNFIPSLLNQLVTGAAGSTGGGGPGDNLFGKIKENLIKFGSGILNLGKNAIDFGKRVFEGGVNAVRQGLAKASDMFSSLFERQTVENLSNGGQTTIEQKILTSGNFVQNRDLFSWETELGGEKISIAHLGNGEYIVQEGNQTKTFYQLLTDDLGRFYGDVTIATGWDGGNRMIQSFAANGDYKVRHVIDGNVITEFISNDGTPNLNGDLISGEYHDYGRGYGVVVEQGMLAELEREVYAGIKLKEGGVERIDWAYPDFDSDHDLYLKVNLKQSFDANGENLSYNFELDDYHREILKDFNINPFQIPEAFADEVKEQRIDFKNTRNENLIRFADLNPMIDDEKLEQFKNLGPLEQDFLIENRKNIGVYERNTEEAFRISNAIYSKINRDHLESRGRGDAFRHMLWGALLTREVGADKARQLTTAHEIPHEMYLDKTAMIDVRMDLYNNEIGIQIALKNSGISDDALIEIITQAIDSRQALYYEDANGMRVPPLIPGERTLYDELLGLGDSKLNHDQLQEFIERIRDEVIDG